MVAGRSSTRPARLRRLFPSTTTLHLCFLYLSRALPLEVGIHRLAAGLNGRGRAEMSLSPSILTTRGCVTSRSEARKFTASEAIVRVPTTSALSSTKNSGVVVGGRLGGVLIARGDPEKDVQAGDLLGEEREVLGRADRALRATSVRGARFSTGAIRAVSASSLTVVSYILVDGHLGLRARALGDFLGGESDVAVGLLPHLLVVRPDGAASSAPSRARCWGPSRR